MEKKIAALYNYLKDNNLNKESEDILYSFLIYKEAGMIKPPPKLVENIYKWVKAKAIGASLKYLEDNRYIKDNFSEVYKKLSRITKNRNDLFSPGFNEIEGKISPNFKDWKGFSDEIIEDAEKLGLPILNQKIMVVLTKKQLYDENPRAGSYEPLFNVVEVVVGLFPFGLANKDFEKVLEDYLAFIKKTIEHELIHYAQNILKHYLVRKDKLDRAIKFDPDSGSGIAFKRKNKERAISDEILSDIENLSSEEKRWAIQYLRPAEFYTYLNNYYIEIKSIWNNNRSLNSQKEFNVLFETFVEDSLFFNILKKYKPKLYRKAISILYKELILNLEFSSVKSRSRLENRLVSGETVNITGGPYETLSGKIVSLDENSAKVEIDIFGRKVVADIPIHFLKRK